MSRFRPASLQPILDELGQSIIVFDQFNRADTESGLGKAPTGQAWQPQSGIFVIRGKKAVKDSGGLAYDQAVVDAGISNAYVEVDVTYATNENGGLVIRNTNNSNFIQATISSTGLSLRKVVAGVYTDLGSFSFAPVNKQVYHLSVKADGNNIKVYLDGEERISVSDSFNSIATMHGIRVPTDISKQLFLDNFKVTRI